MELATRQGIIWSPVLYISFFTVLWKNWWAFRKKPLGEIITCNALKSGWKNFMKNNRIVKLHLRYCRNIWQMSRYTFETVDYQFTLNSDQMPLKPLRDIVSSVFNTHVSQTRKNKYKPRVRFRITQFQNIGIFCDSWFFSAVCITRL